MIQKIGRYLVTDEDGFLLPDVAKHYISAGWQALINQVIDFIEKNESDNIVSVYLRGSVPRGLAIDFVSDLDLILIGKNPQEELDEKTISFKKEMAMQFPFCNGIEWEIDDVVIFQKKLDDPVYSYIAKTLKTQALHLWGVDFAKDLPKVRPGKEMVMHAYHFEDDWRRFHQKMATQLVQDRIDSLNLWMGKRIMRTAFELASLKRPLFTRDIYFCYELAAEEYPEIKTSLYDVMNRMFLCNSSAEEIIRDFTPAADFLIQKKRFLFI